MWAISSLCLLLHWSSLQILSQYCSVITESLKYFNIYQQSFILKNNLKKQKYCLLYLSIYLLFLSVLHFNPLSPNVDFVQFLFYSEELYLACFVLQGFLQCLVFLNCLYFVFILEECHYCVLFSGMAATFCFVLFCTVLFLI